uniref:UDP-galactopyranose mutase C-terminal domain-containing protein n=1 Tax=viral metagenome TaxID=1070528 RepID=A0A6C0HDP7_9ZZZZ
MIEINKYDVIIVGAGLSGCVMAERFANIKNKKVLIIEKREHIGGNCYDYIDENGILINKYGAHLFHTNDEEVWEYINKFSKWVRWEHEVKCIVDNKIIPLPINITSINMMFNLHIKNEKEMDEWLEQNKIRYDKITNGEESVKSRFGEQIYEKIFKYYTYKQWNKYPNELNEEVLSRIPLRNNFDTRYFNDRYQVLPEKGYTNFFNQLIDNKNIDIVFNIDFETIKNNISEKKIVIYTGPIDFYFNDKNMEKLEYRSINFIIERYKNTNYYQSNSVINYPSIDIDYTRIVEYKHFLNQKSAHTTIVKEISTDKGDPYYPVLNQKNLTLYNKYKMLAEDEMKNKNIHFLGRLANYKYFNMDQAIKNSLEYFNNNFNL